MWFVDQKIISIRIQDWVDRLNKTLAIYRVSDKGYKRLDRIYWKVNEDIESYFDAHMLLKPFQSSKWSDKILPLIDMMYNESDATWCQEYVDQFVDSIQIYIQLNEPVD